MNYYVNLWHCWQRSTNWSISTMDLIKANDSLTLRVTLNICYFLIPIHFDHTLCTEKSISSKASETKPNIFVKGGNFGIKSRFWNPRHMSPKDQKALITALKSCQKCRKLVKAVEDVAKVIKVVQSMDGKRCERLV